MISSSTCSLRFAVVPLAVALLSACGGASKSDFVEACLIEAGDAGPDRRAVCECGADVAKSRLSDDAYQAMIYEMAGEAGKARKISEAMSESEQMAFIDGVGQIFDKCAEE